jgi:RND family efflux transporter MFP subunit
MKRWLKYGIPVILIAAAVIWVNRQLTLTVLVAPATTGTAVNAVTGTVEVWASADIRVKARHRGPIADLRVDAGDRVEAGDVIAVQSSEELELRIAQTGIQLEAARARGELETVPGIELESLEEQVRAVELAVELKQAPASRLEALERDRRKARVFRRLDEIQRLESIRLLEIQLQQLQLQRDQMTNRAPFSGTIAAINAFKGDLVNDGQNLVRLVSKGRHVQMELTEEDYFGVEDGQPVTIRLASYPDRTFSGVVTRLADVANAGSKTRDLIVQVDAPESVLVPGLTGEGYLVKDERDGAVLIPRRALIGNLVYVAVNGVVEVRRVRPGYLGLNKAEILEGVQAGELVILEDQNLLKPGDRVGVVESGAR